MVHRVPPAARMVRSRDAIVVVGMGRSGTSALARVLTLCGGALPFPLLPSNFANPTGFWEPERAVDLNNAFLDAQGSSFFDAGLTLQTEPVTGPDRVRFVEQIVAFLTPALASRRPVVLKEPRISALLPYWIEALTACGVRPSFVHIVRNPAGVAASLAARDRLSLQHALALWLKYNLIGERDTRGAPRVFVSYEELMTGWEAVVARCVAELDIGLEVRADMRASVAAFLSPDLDHNRSAAIDARAVDPALVAWVSVAHVLLQQPCGPEFRTSLLDQVLRDFANWSRANAPPVDLAAIREHWEALERQHA